MDKEKNRPKTFKTIAIRVSALVLSIWLLFMACLTWAVAQDFFRQMEEKMEDLAYRQVRYGTSYSQELPGYLDMLRVQRLGEAYTIARVDQLLPFVYPQMPDSYGSRDWFYGKWDLVYGFQPAVIFYDKNHQILMKSGNVFSFSYCSEEKWTAQTPEVEGLGYIDLDAMEYGQNQLTWMFFGWPQGSTPSSFWNRVLRMTGYFEGNQFIPVTIDSGFDPFVNLDENQQALARQDSRGQLHWENLYTAEVPENVKLTRIYSWEAGGYEYDHRSVRANGAEFASLVELLDTSMGSEKWYSYRRPSLFDCIMIAKGTLEGDPEVGTYALAIRCWPVQYALLRLIPAYLVSFALILLLLRLLLKSIRRHLTDPMQTMIRNLVRDYPIAPGSGWHEPYALETILKGEQAQRRQLVNDNQQLQTSLDYAKNAEENRRQLVSNITHELKTPLAIIHSYAEALQSGIAEEKKEKYLSTILEEAERMDAMVLEMLDHSRLESGKVKLSADYFSLFKLTESIAEKLAPAMAERNLQLYWGLTNDCFLTADEARMGQVVTNLLTNAVRYTPDGGTIWLRVFADEKNATFQIENKAEHLPKEVLEKIFETFYRAEDSRTGKGTGLGLPIAKSIIELHRGRLVAQNTWVNGQKCIQFSFTIPLK